MVPVRRLSGYLPYILRVAILALLMAAFVELLYPSGMALGWSSSAHRRLTKDALSVMPQPIKELLESNLESLLDGSVTPDKIPHAQDAHMLNPDRTGGAALLLDQFAKEAEALIRSNAPWDKVAFVLGEAGHMIQDLNQPQHADKGEGKDNHEAYERVAKVKDWPRPGSKDGYEGPPYFESYSDLARQTASWSRSYFYQVKDGPYTGSSAKSVIGETYNHAVNDTANLWLSILDNAQRKTALPPETPTPAKEQRQKSCLFF